MCLRAHRYVSLSLSHAQTLAFSFSRSFCKVVSVDGPYGAYLDVDEYDELLLLAGGIGFTPIHSILRQVLHHTKEQFHFQLTYRKSHFSFCYIQSSFDGK